MIIKESQLLNGIGLMFAMVGFAPTDEKFINIKTSIFNIVVFVIAFVFFISAFVVTYKEKQDL